MKAIAAAPSLHRLPMPDWQIWKESITIQGSRFARLANLERIHHNSGFKVCPTGKSGKNPSQFRVQGLPDWQI
jgi:hypothetical protein